MRAALCAASEPSTATRMRFIGHLPSTRSYREMPHRMPGSRAPFPGRGVAPGPSPRVRPAVTSSEMGEAIHLHDVSGEPIANESVALLDGGREAFPRMLEAIERASQSIHLEVYTFSREGIGEEFLAALGGAARRGVRVTVILDGWGSALDGRYVQALLEADGCEVSIYNPVMALLVGRFRRNHRKILLVDGEVAYIGGVNISDEYGHTGPGHAPEIEERDP